MESMKMIYLLSLVLAPPVIEATGLDPTTSPPLDPTPGELHAYVVAQRDHLAEKFQLLDMHRPFTWNPRHLKKFRGEFYTLRDKCEPAQANDDQMADVLFYYGVRADAPNGWPKFEGEKVFQQIYNGELEEGAELGINEVFMPKRGGWGYEIVTCNGKQMIIAVISNGHPWKYEDFKWLVPPPPRTTTTPTTPTTTTTTEKPTTTKKTTTTADPNANGSGNPTGDPNGGSGAETTTTDSANGDRNGDQNGGTEETTETTTDGTTIDPLGDEDVRKRLPSDQEEIEFDAGSLEQFEFEGFLDSSSALRFLLIVSIVLVGFLY